MVVGRFRSRAGLVFGIAAALVLSPLALMGTTPAGAAPSCTGTTTVTCTFAFTGSADSFTVPAGVTQITVDAFGAQGGPTQVLGTAGGLGGEATATIAVTPGEVLQVNVGGQPASCKFTSVGTSATNASIVTRVFEARYRVCGHTT